MQRQEIHHRIIIAMAMHMVMQGMFDGLSDTLRHDVRRRYNIMNDQLSKFNKYISKLDEPASKHILNKALEIAELFDNNKHIYDFGPKEGVANSRDEAIPNQV